MNKSNPTISTKESLQESRATGGIPIIAGSIVQESLTSHPFTERKLIDEFLESAKECGFNMGTIYGNPATVVNFFTNFHEKAYAEGLKLILGSSIITQNQPFEQNENAINKLKQDIAALDVHKVLGGWSAVSEPKYANLENVRKYYDCLKDYSNTDTEVIMSLIGSLMKTYTGPSKTYQEYLEHLLNVIPGLTPLQNNHLPFVVSDGKFTCNSIGYYDILLNLLEVSNSRNVPFWTYCHCMQLFTVTGERETSDGMGYNTYTRPSATLETMRYEIFSALAYGSKGIEFYDYSRRNNNSQDFFGEALAEIQVNGAEKAVYRTPEWYAAQQVISEVKRYETIFSNGTVVSVKHHVRGGIQTKQYEHPQIKVVAIDNIITIGVSTVGGVVVSRIQSSGNSKRDWLVIVNKSPFAPQRVTLTFNALLIREETITKKFIVNKKETDMYFDPSGTSAILEEDTKTINQGISETRTTQTRQLYPGGYIIFQLMTPLT